MTEPFEYTGPEGVLWKQHIIAYQFEGRKFDVKVWARSPEEAQNRLATAAQFGTYTGTLEGIYPVNEVTKPVVGLWLRLTCWLRNLRA